MISTVTIDSSALDRLQMGFDIDIDWFQTWSGENLPSEICRVVIGEHIYLLGQQADADSKLLIIDVKSSGLFKDLATKNRPEALFRLIRLGRSAHTPGQIPIPISWSPYRAGSIISFRSNNNSSGEQARIQVDLNPQSTNHAFAYKIGKEKNDLHNTEIDYKAFQNALMHYEDAVLEMLSKPPKEISLDNSKIILSNLNDKITLGRSLDDWINSFLTEQQIKFVHAPLQKSLRLIGAAGTGKTLALVVKCLSNFKLKGSSTQDFRCLFLTHSQATVETVTNAISSMDHEGITNRWPNSILKICTLQELANEAMKYDLHGLEPLSNDGLEGRRLQIEAIESGIETFVKGDWITYKGQCSQNFKESMEAPKGTPKFRTFAFELMNEFACVLEADGVRQSAERRKRYIHESRKTWMMPLDNQADRQAVLALYDNFRKFLREMGVIGSDQMISDFLGYLDSNRWDNIRLREGFDIIFVDELHLFNRQERMTLHQLMRDTSKPPIVVMAYDSKQSIRDTFYGLAENKDGKTIFARDMQLGETERFDLTKAFRYTPEIAQVLEWIDQTFPAAGISEELGADWAAISLESTQESGNLPILVKARTTKDIFDYVFPKAKKAITPLGKGKHVAVLCASEELFKTYADSGKYKGDFLPITDREQLSNLRYAGKRFILSMPEFVAGVQFDTVFLIEVNEGEVEQGPYSTGALRRFVSLVYTGASRAERVLEIYSSQERGGPSKTLYHAISHRALDVIDLQDL